MAASYTNLLPRRWRYILDIIPHCHRNTIGTPRLIIPIPLLVLADRLFALEVHRVDSGLGQSPGTGVGEQTRQLVLDFIALEERCAGVEGQALARGLVFRNARAVESAEDDLLAEGLV